MNRNWSDQVTRRSHALDLEPKLFTWQDPKKIAHSLKKSALQSHRRKSSPYVSAMSMLTFYINRGGKNIPHKQKLILNQAKVELKKLFKT